MNEKQFYHAALEKSLLGGKSQKARIDRAVRAASSVEKRPDGREWNPSPIPWIAIPVTALLLLATLTVALTGGFARKGHAITQPGSASPQPAPAQNDGDLTVLIENPIRAESFTVRLLPEFDRDLYDECLLWRESQGGAPVTEQDWGWLRDSRIELLGVMQQAGASDPLIWQIRFTPTNMQPFSESDFSAPGQVLEFAVNSAQYTVEGDKTSYPLGGVYNAVSFDADADGITAAWCSDRALPESGLVTVTVQYGIIDCKVEDMQRYFGSVAIVEHTFTLDAGALKGSTTHVSVPLSGTHWLTVCKETHTGYRNEQLSLDGVVLDAEVCRSGMGILLTFTVLDAPESMSEYQRSAIPLSLQNNSFGEGESPLIYVNGEPAGRALRIRRGYPYDGSVPQYLIPASSLSGPISSLGIEGFLNCVTNGDLSYDWSYDSAAGPLSPLLCFASEPLFYVDLPIAAK